ncbi:acyl-CoA dehydrogenase [Paenibacillus yanchengensis]|uniref:Acyl-CoA dehydrogenase n=1 Tax=Paenibacillus yanchengensis TaxID=2035833 RepID=A0ABW4YI29_9BACL
MVDAEAESLFQLEHIIGSDLKPYVRSIDADAYYPLEYMQAVGKEGCLYSAGKCDEQVHRKSLYLLQQTSKTCMTTGFNLWCQLALLTYLRLSSNEQLKARFLQPLEDGRLRGGTGLSNPMKYYAGMNAILLKATRVNGGYVINGNLPMVSNLGENHLFAVIAEVEGERDEASSRIMLLVPFDSVGLKTKEQVGFLGLNGSATYACKFEKVFIADELVIAPDADEFIKLVRPVFVLYQIPLGLGVIEASIRSIEQAKQKQAGSNRYLPIQAEAIAIKLEQLQARMEQLLASSYDLSQVWHSLLQLRLDTVYITLEAVEAAMLHQGSGGYGLTSPPSRRLREAYFFANLTPTVRHLEKMLCRE